MPGTHFPNGISMLASQRTGASSKGQSKSRHGGAVLDVVRRCQVDRLAISVVGGSPGEFDTNIKLPPLAIVHDCWVYLKTLETGAVSGRIDVGPKSSETGGDADGYLNQFSVEAPERTEGDVVNGAPAVTIGGTETFYATPGIFGYGVLLADFQAGADVATDTGLFHKKSHFNSNGNTITWSIGGGGWSDFEGDLYIVYDEILV